MEFTSGGGAVIGHNLVLLNINNSVQVVDDRLTYCWLIGENAEKLCCLFDSLKLLIRNY